MDFTTQDIVSPFSWNRLYDD